MMSLSKISEFAGKRVAVVGDLMLDEFVRGEVTRISPEAPVPILEVKERAMMPGGAANAAVNAASLGGKVSLIGVVGDDTFGTTARALIEQAGIDAQGLVRDAARPTTLKTRIVARNQQVVRIDLELRTPLSPEVHWTLCKAAEDAVAAADVCVVSDYGKGVVTPELFAAIVKVAKAKACPIIVDPKRRDFSVYRGATLLTPNLGELELASGRTCASTVDVLEAVAELLPVIGGGAILVTRGAAGMSLVEPDKPPVHVAARARAVFDVTGAGDTVVATLALALAAGMPLADAIHVASAAAAVVVSKSGTATLNLDELRAELASSLE
jgi:rfaE bifunctional protein kinase chain/domain